MFTHRRRGFTLIELLVVIAIIAILAAILFPVFAQAREKARQTSCLSNIKQIGTGMMMYVQDFDETYPMNQYDDPTRPNTPADPRFRLWTVVVAPYIKNADTTSYGQSGGGVFKCPSFPSEQGRQYGVHYSLSPDGLFSWNPNPVPPASMAQVGEPADKVLIAEKGQAAGGSNQGQSAFLVYQGAWTNSVGTPPGSVDGIHYDLARCAGSTGVAGTAGADANACGDCDYPDSGTPAGASNGCTFHPRYRHGGTANVLFADGHAKSMPRGRLNWFRNIYIEGVMPRPN